MHLPQIFLAAPLLAAAFLLPTLAHAAHSYDGCTGFIDRLPATIVAQGVWCLRKDLGTAITSGRAITIAANNVTIDCNGFKIGGSSRASGCTTDAARCGGDACAPIAIAAGTGVPHDQRPPWRDSALDIVLRRYGRRMISAGVTGTNGRSCMADSSPRSWDDASKLLRGSICSPFPFHISAH